MWKALAEYLLDLLSTARDTRANKVAIVELREEFAELTLAVERLSLELRALREHEQQERARLVLQLENALLRNQGLPAAPKRRTRKKKR